MNVPTIVTLLALTAAPAFAQTDRLSVGGAGGFAVTPDGTSGDVVGEAAYRIAPNLFVIGDLGKFHDLQPSQLQSSITDETVTLLNSGLTVNGEARVPAWYMTGGLKMQFPTSTRITPYAYAGLGFARITPTARFTYTGGTLLGSSPSPGDDVTDEIVSLGDYTQPAASTALMVSFGGGIETPIAPHVALNVGYRLSRVSADTPVNAQSVMFGFGYHF